VVRHQDLVKNVYLPRVAPPPASLPARLVDVSIAMAVGRRLDGLYGVVHLPPADRARDAVT
jgi:hypothetical protein